MPTEVEIKLKVDSHEPTRQRLRELGAHSRGMLLETNRIFDDGGRTLLASDRGLRIRECRGGGTLVETVLTYKGPRGPGDVKQREEIECRVDDPAAAGALLEALGFIEVVRFEKRRESWLLGASKIDLDEVPYLGLYIEIESASEERVRRIQSELGLEPAAAVRGSYIGLLVKHCRANNLPCDRIRF